MGIARVDNRNQSKNFYRPKCPYQGECSSYPEKCNRCRYSHGRDYFEPDIYPNPRIWFPWPVWG